VDGGNSAAALTETNGDAPANSGGHAPASDRAGELESEHWRERAVVWRERALAAELVSRMLQRNLDDLRASLEDLRREAQAVAAATGAIEYTPPSPPAISPAEQPFRRFMRDLYDKYLR
jgi:hypothetical protein